jgi:hypothetical protein
MQAEPQVDLPSLLSEMTARGIRFLVIGRQAMVLYGAPALTFDWDIWVAPADRGAAFAFLVDDRGFEASRAPDDPSPLVTMFAGPAKLDLFFYGAVRNIEGQDLAFEDAWTRSVEFTDACNPPMRLRVPGRDDLVVLKKLRPRNLKDEEDIKYLLAMRDEGR